MSFPLSLTSFWSTWFVGSAFNYSTTCDFWAPSSGLLFTCLSYKGVRWCKNLPETVPIRPRHGEISLGSFQHYGIFYTLSSLRYEHFLHAPHSFYVENDFFYAHDHRVYGLCDLYDLYRGLLCGDLYRHGGLCCGLCGNLYLCHHGVNALSFLCHHDH